jgi:hypothetical protein
MNMTTLHLDNAVALNKGQVLQILMDNDRSAWRVSVTQYHKGSALPVAYTTYLFHDLEEIVTASSNRAYGLMTCHRGGDTFKVATVVLQVGNTTYRFNANG